MLQNTAGDARERLLAAAFEIATRDGVDAVSTRAVCTAAGVQAPSLYHHFGDRSGLIRAVVDVAFEEYFHRKDAAPPVDDADPRARVAAGWDAHIAFALAYPRLTRRCTRHRARCRARSKEAVRCCAPVSTSSSRQVPSGLESPQRWRRTRSAQPCVVSPTPSPRTPMGADLLRAPRWGDSQRFGM
ncbi:TetR/AcrR family transcriptional regulator [Streptomyces sp. NPDC056160]|uniref:TetR/AcrR family transcriptional regulator n=1 Tax=Streptomyces sp. NPDC056160 TaxID=3345731 RepID=UPI0035DC3A14